MGGLRDFLRRLTAKDEARLLAEIRAWAETVPGTVPIADAERRQHVKIAGVIRRITVFPTQDSESLEAVVSDGTGDIVVRFMGRRAIGGLGLGSRIVIEGVLGEHRGEIQMINPRLEFTA